jgi:anti-anti-sigma factor
LAAGPFRRTEISLGLMQTSHTTARILIVDDDDAISRLLADVLEREGYDQVLTADSGDAARTRLQAEAVDLVITDLNMPGTDGLALMQWAQVNCPGPLWIILSGATAFENAVRAVRLGAFDFITKPFAKLEPLLVAVRNALQQKRLMDERERLGNEVAQRNTELHERVHQLDQAVHLLREQADTIRRDLARAELVQRALLPRRIPELGAFAFDTYYQPSQNVGGDIFGIEPVDEDHVAFYVADAAGHGVSAAMVAVMFKLNLRMRDEKTGQPLAPDQILREVNRAIVRECTASSLFITAALCLLDTRSGDLAIASGGHPPLLVSHVSGETRKIPPTGPALGLMSSATFGVTKLQLSRGDRLFLYTDGLTDAAPGMKRLAEADLLTQIADAKSERPRLLRQLVDSAVRRHGPQGQLDDITLVLVTAGERGVTLGDAGAATATAAARHEATAVASHKNGDTIEFANAGDEAVFCLHGGCRWTQATPFHEACLHEVTDRHGIALELSGCDFLDSTFLGTIQDIVAQADAAGVPVRLYGASPAVKRLFHELGMHHVLAHVSDATLRLPANLTPLPEAVRDTARHKERMLAAHEALAAVDESNRERFSDVLEHLRDADADAAAERPLKH